MTCLRIFFRVKGQVAPITPIGRSQELVLEHPSSESPLIVPYFAKVADIKSDGMYNEYDVDVSPGRSSDSEGSILNKFSATLTPICRHVHQVNSPLNLTAFYRGFQDRCGPFHTPLLNLKRSTEKHRVAQSRSTE